MPSTITHAYFSMDIYERLDKKSKDILLPYKSQLKAFAQGPDALFFYNFFSPFKGKEIRNLGHYMQQNKTQDFFVNLITIIKERKLEKDPEIIAFLYGFICHYVLDMTAHPFVVYKGGIYDLKNKKTNKYFGKHDQIESYIDVYFIKVRNKTKHFIPSDFCFHDINLSPKLKDLISTVFYKTFNIKDMGYKYSKSLNDMKLFYKYFRPDNTGLKKSIYKALQIFTNKIKTEAISYHINLDNNDYYLNLSKEQWHHPLDKNIIYNYSFIELYSIALSNALKLIKEVNKVLNNQESLKYLPIIFPNLSYVTGYDCKLGKGKYFSF